MPVAACCHTLLTRARLPCIRFNGLYLTENTFFE
eukprot:COSAG06_NODE_47183_length_341_cov_0.640496_2_plen_33_part_01